MLTCCRSCVPLLALTSSLVLAACAAEPSPPATPTPAAPEVRADAPATGEPAMDPGEPATDPPAMDTEESTMPGTTPAVETKATEPLTPGKPVTVRLELPEDLRQVVHDLDSAASNAPNLRLTLKGLDNPGAEVSVRAFVNAPNAAVDTPIENPHYLGDVGFYPTSVYGGGGTEDLPDGTFLLDVGSTLAALPPEKRLVDGRFLDVTLLVAPMEGITARPDVSAVSIPFDSVQLSLHGGGPSSAP